MRKGLIFIFFFLLSIEAFAYEVNVHREISKQAIAASNISQYLYNNLGISLKDEFNRKKAEDWVEDGSDWEDNAPRWLNHYYDPTTGKGLNPCPTTLCKPSLQWGKDATENAWSWKWARDSYYKALTDANPNYRNIYFSYVFRALGQVIHLVQDKAVPAHVRNDPHGAPIIKYDMYEAFTRDNVGSLTYSGYPAVSITTFNSIDRFWIHGGNGLAEYTNKNFFSRDTIFKNYPHPAKTNTTAALVEQYAKDGKKDSVYYIQGYTSQRLAAYSYLNKWLLPDKWEYNLDAYVHEDYASQLIPRAVGYSAGLLNYFFRGELDMIKDPNNPNQYIIKNLSNENMFGAFSLYYDDTNNNRYLVASWGNLAINANSQSSPVTFTAPSSPAPKEKGKYILVFQGTFGNEIGAVMGKVVEGLCAGRWHHTASGGCQYISPNTNIGAAGAPPSVIQGIYLHECYRGIVFYGTIPTQYICTGQLNSVTESPCYTAPYYAGSQHWAGMFWYFTAWASIREWICY